MYKRQIGGAVVTSLLTLYVMVLVWAKGFLRDRADAPEGHLAMARPSPLSEVTEYVELEKRDDVGRLPFGMLASTSLLVIASVSMSFLAGPISGVTTRAATSAQDDSIYRYAVLGDSSDDPTRHLDPKDRYDSGADSLENRNNPLPEPMPAAPTTEASTSATAPLPTSVSTDEKEVAR